MNLDFGAAIELDHSLVPEDLAYLLPLVQKWAFSSQEDQDRFVELVRTERPDELYEFNCKIDAARERIVEWGKTLEQFTLPIQKTDEEAWNHPYWAFLTMLRVREITGVSEDHEVVHARKKAREEARRFRLGHVLERVPKVIHSLTSLRDMRLIMAMWINASEEAVVFS